MEEAMNVTIGSAPDSWGVWFPSDERQTPWHRFLDEVAEAGYEWTELGPYGYLPTDPETLRAELAKRNLRITGATVIADLDAPDSWPEVERQVRGGGALAHALGGEFIVLIDDPYTNLFTGEQIAPKRLDDEGWERLIRTTHRAADIARDHFGQRLVFHPHAETHVEYEDQIERLLADTDPERVGLCFDTGHHAYRGGDPVAFMKKHHARIPYLHLKSVRPEMIAKVARENIPFAIAVGSDMFCEPSEGAVDFLAFRDVLRDIDYSGLAVVEQDMYPVPFDKPLPIAKRTRAYLREIGIG
jgi:inosose dehydratase